MNCGEYRGDLIELARGNLLNATRQRSLAIHLGRCEECGHYLAEQQALTASEAALVDKPIPSAEEIGVRVMSEFDRARAGRRSKAGRLWLAAAGLAAAACLILIPIARRSVPPSQPTAGEAAGFVTIPYTVPLAPQEPAAVVRMEIPVPALIAAGFQVDASDPAATVEADVLVSQDGRARAIRPLSISISN